MHFGTTLVLDLVLLGLWTAAHPDVVPALFDAKRTDVAQTYALIFIAVCSALNLFIVGPYTAKYVPLFFSCIRICSLLIARWFVIP